MRHRDNKQTTKITLVLLAIGLVAGNGLVMAGNLDETTVQVKILGINDFHGQIGAGKYVSSRPVGSAPVLASYLKDALAGYEGHGFIVHAGDFVGASPAASAMLQDEPSIMFFNLLGNEYCSAAYRLDRLGNLVGTVGNHELDEGVAELWRLTHGGDYETGPFLESPYAGANFPYVCANVVDANTLRPVFLPYVIKEVEGLPIAFIGAILKETPAMVTPSGVASVVFLDEVESINYYAQQLSAEGVHSIVVLLHQGGGEADAIVAQLDNEVDVVLSGHTHGYANELVTTVGGQDILVTQSYSAGTAYTDITLAIDPITGDIVDKSAEIMTTWADEGPGLTPDAEVAALVAQAEDVVAPLVNQLVGAAASELSKTQNNAGESALGNLIADAQRTTMDADFAFMNPGGIRADIPAGDITWGDLQTVQPFNNYLVSMNLTGQQIYDLLEQQWVNQPYTRMLQISGLTYTWDNAQPEGARIVEIRQDGNLIDPAATYVIVCNSFLADGGDNFTVFTQGTDRVVGPVDLDALVDYVKTLTQPFTAMIEGRIMRLN